MFLFGAGSRGEVGRPKTITAAMIIHQRVLGLTWATVCLCFWFEHSRVFIVSFIFKFLWLVLTLILTLTDDFRQSPPHPAPLPCLAIAYLWKSVSAVGLFVVLTLTLKLTMTLILMLTLMLMLTLTPTSISILIDKFRHAPMSRYSSSGVLVRSTTCERVTNSLPKLSLLTLSPPETAG